MFKDMLIYLRKENKISQKELAKVIDVAPSTISMYEMGKRMPNDEILYKIASFFNVSIDYLLGYSTNRESKEVDTDDPLYEYLEDLRSNPDMRMLFSLAKNASKDEVSRAVAVLQAMLGK